MELTEIINQVPKYKEFMTIAELDASSKNLASESENVELKKIGKSLMICQEEIIERG